MSSITTATIDVPVRRSVERTCDDLAILALVVVSIVAGFTFRDYGLGWDDYTHAEYAEYLVCLEDGKRFKSLKRHLRTQYAMTPEQYREKWGLPADYPMVAPNYAVARSQLAKKMGLGQQRRRRSK